MNFTAKTLVNRTTKNGRLKTATLPVLSQHWLRNKVLQTAQVPTLNTSRLDSNYGLQLREGRFRLDIRNSLFSKEWGAGKGCPGRWWSHRPGDVREPCRCCAEGCGLVGEYWWKADGGLDDLGVFFQPRWFYDSIPILFKFFSKEHRRTWENDHMWDYWNRTLSVCRMCALDHIEPPIQPETRNRAFRQPYFRDLKLVTLSHASEELIFGLYYTGSLSSLAPYSHAVIAFAPILRIDTFSALKKVYALSVFLSCTLQAHQNVSYI